MTFLCRALSTLCVVSILSHYALAQRPSAPASSSPQQSIESLLASDDSRLVAWGAHNALLAHRRDLIPDLLSLAAKWQPIEEKNPGTWNAKDNLSEDESDRRDAMQVVLDALIQMKAPVPAEIARIVASNFENDAAVLLSQAPPEQTIPFALALYRSASGNHGPVRYVTAATLALHPPPGFAAELLSDTTVFSFVFVVRPGSEPFGFSTNSGHDCSFPGWGASRRDWPLVPVYILRRYAASNDKKETATLIVGGIDPVYATRQEVAHYRAEYCGTSMEVFLDSDEPRRLIAEMLGVSPETIPWQVRLQTRIEYRSSQQFYRDLFAFIASEQAKYRTTISALLNHDLVTPEEAQQCLPKLTLLIKDAREEDAGASILEPSNLPAHVEWSGSPF